MSTKKKEKDIQEEIPKKVEKAKKKDLDEVEISNKKKVQEKGAEDKPILEKPKQETLIKNLEAAAPEVARQKNSRRILASVIPERFDVNYVEALGTISKIWSRVDNGLNNVYASLSFSTNGGAERRNHATILYHDGLMHGKDLSLMPKERLAIRGWVTDIGLKETFKGFLDHYRRVDLLLKYPVLQEIASEEVERRITCIDVPPKNWSRRSVRIGPNRRHNQWQDRRAILQSRSS